MSPALTQDSQWLYDGRIFCRDESVTAADNVVLPLTQWRQGGQVRDAVWLGPADEPHELSDHVSRLTLIGIDFPKFTDGRGFSIAWLLRSRYGYKGDLRAIGDVLVDQLYYLRRVGFSSFALKPGQDPLVAERALTTFTDSYQGSADRPVPAFRRSVRPFAEIQ